jgi:hypothetical protein
MYHVEPGGKLSLLTEAAPTRAMNPIFQIDSLFFRAGGISEYLHSRDVGWVEYSRGAEREEWQQVGLDDGSLLSQFRSPKT